MAVLLSLPRKRGRSEEPKSPQEAKVCSANFIKVLVFTVRQVSFKQGMELRVTGVPKPNPDRFTINVGESDSKIALHVNPRFQGSGPGVIVLNAMKDGSWDTEVRDERNFPFQQGEEFEVSITFANEQFYISLHNGHMLEFPNRLEQPQYSKIWFIADVRITGIYLKSRPTRRC
ncbi:congerin-2-like [Conger conger]|uniref:congerin-2-like n=1 Tax=Conger conger TaxID=82655 RepID=UPI002A5AD3EB|nr:congerin-2-like [Conger conger]